MSYPTAGDPLSELIKPWEADDQPCAPGSFRIRWDQWAVCVFRCKHGNFRGVSRGQQDMFDAVKNAYRKFAAFDHTEEVEEVEDDGWVGAE